MTRRLMKPSRSFLCRSAGKRACFAGGRCFAGERGSVLILVAWVLCLLAVYAVSLGMMARNQLLFSQRLVLDADLRRVAASGLNRARALLARPEVASVEGKEGALQIWMEREDLFKAVDVGASVFSLGYLSYDGVCGTPRFFYGLADEEGKVDLNTASPDVLARLFESVLCDTGPIEAQELADAVVDWRDEDSAEQPKGAEDGFYGGLPDPYDCKDAPFESPDELLLVRGFNATIYKNIKGYVTVVGAGQVNINTAPAVVLGVLGLDVGLVSKIVGYRCGSDALWGTPDDRLFESSGRIVADLEAFSGLTDQERAVLESLVLAQVFSTTSSHFSATCTAQRGAQEGGFSVTAVFVRTLTEEGSYNVQPLYWRTSS